MSHESGRLAGILLNTTPLLFACANNHSLTVVARKPIRSRDRREADAQLGCADAGLLRGTTA